VVPPQRAEETEVAIVRKFDIAIDPGLRHLGLAVAVDGHIAYASLVRNGSKSRGPDAWLGMAHAVKQDLERLGLRGEWAETVIVEKMQVYDRANHKEKGKRVDPDDLLELAGVTGAIVGRVFHFSLYRHVSAAEWKGQVPKDVMVERIRGKLSQDVLGQILEVPKSYQHNVIDACGLMMFHLTGG
jgi:hypothetical protein